MAVASVIGLHARLQNHPVALGIRLPTVFFAPALLQETYALVERRWVEPGGMLREGILGSGPSGGTRSCGLACRYLRAAHKLRRLNDLPLISESIDQRGQWIGYTTDDQHDSAGGQRQAQLIRGLR